MKLRLDEYYSIINDEWEGIENYMPEDMAEEFEKFRESHIDNELQYHNVCTNGLEWKFCIPYNDDTKHLLCTTEEAPEYYRY